MKKSFFILIGEDVPVQEGDIIYVPAGIAHHFHSLKDDLEVLILWEGQ